MNSPARSSSPLQPAFDLASRRGSARDTALEGVPVLLVLRNETEPALEAVRPGEAGDLSGAVLAGLASAFFETALAAGAPGSDAAALALELAAECGLSLACAAPMP